MPLFQSLLLLLFVSSFLLAGSRRLGVPYPTLLALAGAGAALLPLADQVTIEPHLALAVFIAPALFDAAYDTNPRELRRLWAPLLALAVGAVLTTTAAVAYVGVQMAGLPIAAAIALGAIVAPPDAVAANTVLNQVGFPRRSTLVLQGESLLNDATALLIFSAAVAAAAPSASDGGLLRIALAVPGGVLLGGALAALWIGFARLFEGTLSGVVMQFTSTFGAWLIADRLHLSPILTVVTYAMVLARWMPARQSARDRVQSYAVWAAVVFVLNVLAFLLMGLQARVALAALKPGELGPALAFAGVVLLVVIAARFFSLIGYRLLAAAVRRRVAGDMLPEPAPLKVGLLMSWCGMRGLVTLATAFALPRTFPERPLVVLTALAVVMGTLLLQGLTLKPLLRMLRIHEVDGDALDREIGAARRRMLEAALAAAAREPGEIATLTRAKIAAALEVSASADPQGPSAYDEAAMRAVSAQRAVLHAMRDRDEVADDVFHHLEEELDWVELAARPNRELEVVDG